VIQGFLLRHTTANVIRVLFVSRALPRVCAAVLAGLLGFPAVAAPGDGHWDRQFGMAGTGTRNYALRFNGNLLYTAGYSLVSGQLATNTVVNIFDGTNWRSIGEITGGTLVIYDFAFLGPDVYVGGVFTQAGDVPAVGLAKWDGSSWSGVGGFSGVVFDLTTDGSNLYVGGAFTNAGGILATNIARWDGTNWSALGDGIGYYDNFLFPSVNAMVWHDGQLYVGGAFTNAGTTAVSNLARWDGSAWSPVGGGVAGEASLFTGVPVSTLQFLGDDLYVGGHFTTVGDSVPALNVARWDGSTWSALGSGLKAAANSAPVNALAFLGTDLYATGGFTNAGGITAKRVAKGDGFSWSSIGAINGTAVSAVSNSGSIYLCGDFNLANTVIGNHIIRWDGANWYGVTGKPAQGTHFFVQAMGLAEDGLYMGGFFSAVGNTPASRVARWDGTNWHLLADGLTGSFAGGLDVRAIKARNNEVYIGGDFSSAGGIYCTNIALWDGNNWSALGNGFDGAVGAIEVTPTDVYVGGGFTNAYDFPGFGTIVNRIARWDGGTWWNLGGGVSGSVSALYAANGILYVGGSFTNAGGNAANRIATWDGNNWSSLGTGAANGVSGTVNAVLVDGTDVYVGGSFTTAGGVSAPGIAKWDGNNWSSVGQGVFYNGTAAVRSLAKIGRYLYATGTFTNAGGTTLAHSIARWDGTQWEALGSGIGNTTSVSRGNVLVAWDNDLFVGGIFEDAGGGDSGYIARWNDQIDFTPPATLRLLYPQMLPGNLFKFRATATERAAYVVESSADLVTWTPLLTNSLSVSDITNSAASADFRTYRMRQVP
jgi:trimeric autotransporter adhesin